MLKEFLAGLDLGTTGAKTSVYDLDGKEIGSAYIEYGCDYPRPGWVEQDAQLIIDSAKQSSRGALKNADVAPDKIASIGVSAQRSCTIFVGAEDKPLKMISWQDSRTSLEVEEIKGKIPEEEYYKITGLPVTFTWLLPKFLWFRKNDPGLWKRTKKIVQLHDLALKALGAEDFFIDTPDALWYGFWNANTHTWDSDLMSLLEIDFELLPTPVKPGTQVGNVSAQASEEFGFAAGTPIVVGCGDSNCSALGAGIIQEGDLSISIGTGGISIACLDDPIRNSDLKPMVGYHAIQGKWELEGFQAGAGSVYRWFRDEIARPGNSGIETLPGDTYEMLNKLVGTAPAGAKGLIFLPFLAGAAVPKWNADAKGTLVGLTFAHDRGSMARAFIEGITMEQKDNVLAMKNAGVSINRIHIVGGATKSELWNQMQADMYGAPVSTLKVANTPLAGAAILAGVGVGLFKNAEEGVKRMVTLDKTYEPRKEHVKIYNDLYDVYNRVYEGLTESGAYKALSAIQASQY